MRHPLQDKVVKTMVDNYDKGLGYAAGWNAKVTPKQAAEATQVVAGRKADLRLLDAEKAWSERHAFSKPKSKVWSCD